VRLFLAINLDPSVRREIVDATSDLRDAAPTLTWIDADRVHLTLKFLGEQTAEVAERLAATATEIARQHRAFAIQLRGIGAFPNFRRARVVWMGVEHEPRLELLHHDIELACERLGFELEGRPFRPHLTLARVKERTEETELRRLSRASKTVAFETEATVTSIDVMQSRLHPSGSQYERLHAAPLRLN
jgi:RNA 2',3'-cyclic 3'-phosphodiesterase